MYQVTTPTQKNAQNIPCALSCMRPKPTAARGGAVVGFFDCPGYIGTADPADETMANLSTLSVEQLEEYRGGAWLYGWKVQNPRRLPEPVPLEAIHMDRAPQSWCWLNSINAADLAEIAAAQGVKL